MGCGKEKDMPYLGIEENTMTKNRLLKLAQKRGVEIKKNNISRAKPLEKICGNLKATSSMSIRQLFCR